jgi:hypothetical protein
MEPHGQVRGTSISSAESAEAYPPPHKALAYQRTGSACRLEGYPFRIHPRPKALPARRSGLRHAGVVFCVGGQNETKGLPAPLELLNIPHRKIFCKKKFKKKAQGSFTWALTNDLDGYKVTSHHSIFHISLLKSDGESSLLRSWAFLHP